MCSLELLAVLGYVFYISGFTGIDQAYEAPENPELFLKTVDRSIKDTVTEVITMLENKGIIPRAANDRIEELMVTPEKTEEFLKNAEKLPSVEINKLDLQWVQVLGEGWASPLKGKKI